MRMFKPRSLRYQLLARMLFILSFILVIIGFLQYWVMKDFLYKNQAETLRTQLMSFSRELLFENELFSREAEEDEHKDERSRFLFLEDFSFALVEADGTYTNFLDHDQLPAPELSNTEIQNLSEDHDDINYKIARDSNGDEQLLVFRPLGHERTSNGSFLQLGIRTHHLKEVLWQQLLTFVILSIIAFAAGLVVYFSMIRKTLKPLSTMVKAVQNINAGSLATRIPSKQGQEEIDRLSDSFNDMLERLEASFEHEKEAKEQMRRFIADASHELRTPLTSIHGFLEVLLRGAADRPDQLYTALNSMHGESKRIIKLVEDLLLLAKMDRAPVLQLVEADLSELVQEMRPQLMVLAGNREVEFAVTEGIHGKIDPDKIKQVILNLFQNAVQHTDADGGKIKVSLNWIGHQAIFSVGDNGPGIKEENLPYLFDRFYRIDESRARKYGGAGLGLSITKSIIEAHGGSVAVESKVGAGAMFSVALPL